MSSLPLAQIETVNPLTSRDPLLKRQPPRPPHLRETSYLDNFDSETIIYDAYWAQSQVVLICPPLLNLEVPVLNALRESLGELIETKVHNLDRTTRIDLTGVDPSQQTIEIQLNNRRCIISISKERTEIFKNRRVLFTKSKNNDLEWIRDWAEFYVINHKVDALLLYDNGSTNYSVADIADQLDIPSLETAIIVEWPFKFGPQGGTWTGSEPRPWDSDYCEYSIIEHARHKYLTDSSVVILHDIDELLITEDNRSIDAHLDECGSDYLTYRGVWVDDYTQKPTGTPRFQDFFFIDKAGEPTTKKWIAETRKISHAEQWKTHGVEGATAETSVMLKHRHFKGITTDWKWKRSGTDGRRKPRHMVDTHLIASMEAAFGEPGDRTPPGAAYMAGRPEVQQQFLNDVHTEISPERWHPLGMVKSWYWKPNVLVFDFEMQNNARVAFEIRLEAGKCWLIATGRNEASIELLQATVGTETTHFNDSQKHWIITWWRLYTSAYEIAKDCLFQITEVATQIRDQRLF